MTWFIVTLCLPYGFQEAVAPTKGNSEGNSQDNCCARGLVDFKFKVEEKGKLFLEEIIMRWKNDSMSWFGVSLDPKCLTASNVLLWNKRHLSFQKDQVLYKEEMLLWVSEQYIYGHNDFIFNFHIKPCSKLNQGSKVKKINGINMSNWEKIIWSRLTKYYLLNGVVHCFLQIHLDHLGRS